MTYFPADELIACIRHELHAEDETGLCDKLFPPLDRRAKYGGLPINFRSKYEDDEDEDELCFELIDEEEQPGTSTIIEQRLRARTQDSDAENQKMIPPIFNSTLIPIAGSAHTPGAKPESSQAIEPQAPENDNPWSIFARFEAVGRPNSCHLEMIYVPRIASKDDRYEFSVDVLPTARIWQVIGLCCHVYHRLTETLLSGEPSDYELYITDEGEVETDFPPLETARSIGELGFRSLALIPRMKTGEKQHRVTVYFTTGEKYVFDLEHLGQTVGWLRARALERRFQDLDAELQERALIVPDYTIETANGFEVKLNAEQTIESTHSIDFVMYRKNSSRANYHPHGLMPSRQISLLSSPTGLLTPDPILTGDANESKKSVFEFPQVGGAAGGGMRASVSSTSPQPSPRVHQSASNGALSSTENGYQLPEWTVDRLHKYKPKYTVELRLQADGVEMNSKEERRRSIMGPMPKRSFFITWDHVARASASMQRFKGSEILPILRIETLAQLDQRKQLPYDELKLESIVQFYSSSTWKSINLQCETIQTAEDIARHIEDEIRERETSGWKAWQHSAEGARRPAVAAELALIEEEGPIVATPSKGGKRHSRLAGTIRRMLSVQKD